MTRQVPVAAVSLVGLALFCWPFLGTGLPDNTPAWTLMLACLAALFAVEAGTRQLDSRAIAVGCQLLNEPTTSTVRGSSPSPSGKRQRKTFE